MHRAVHLYPPMGEGQETSCPFQALHSPAFLHVHQPRSSSSPVPPVDFLWSLDYIGMLD